MLDCKYFQDSIQDFDEEKMTLKNEEQFINHICNCADCREEMELYYVIEYGLSDKMDNLDTFDFCQLVLDKINYSRQKCLTIRRWAKFNNDRYLFVTMIMILTALVLIIIKLF